MAWEVEREEPDTSGDDWGVVSEEPIEEAPQRQTPNVVRRGTMRSGASPYVAGEGPSDAVQSVRRVDNAIDAEADAKLGVLDRPYRGPMPSRFTEEEMRGLVSLQTEPGKAARDRAELARRASTPVLKAGPEPSVLRDALSGTVARPLDESLLAAGIETAGDAARGVVKAGTNFADAGFGLARAGADLVGASSLSDWAGASGEAARGYSTQMLNPSDPESMTTKVFESTFSSVPLMLAAPGAPLTAMMAMSGAQEYSEARARGLRPEEAGERAVVMGLAEGIGERFSLPAFQSLFAAAAAKASTKELGGILADMLVKEQVGEQVTQLFQAGYEKLGQYGTRPDMTLREYIDDSIETAKVTLGQTLLTGGLAGGVRSLASRQSAAIDEQQRQAMQAARMPRVEDMPTTPFTPEQVAAIAAAAPAKSAPAPESPPVAGTSAPMAGPVAGAPIGVAATPQGSLADLADQALRSGNVEPNVAAPAGSPPGAADAGGDQPGGGLGAVRPVPAQPGQVLQPAAASAAGGQADTPTLPADVPRPALGERPDVTPIKEGAFATRGEALAFTANEGIGRRVDIVETPDGGFALQPRVRPATEQTQQEDQRELESLNAAIAKQGWTNDDGSPVAVRAVPDKQTPPGFSSAASAVESAFGVRVVPVAGTPGSGIQYGRRAYVNVEQTSTQEMALGVTGHESLHWLEQNDPKAAAAFYKGMGEFLRPDAVARQLGFENENLTPGEAPMTEAGARSEVMANINGSMWVDPKFWERLYDLDSGSTFRKVLYSFMKHASRLARVVTGGQFDVRRYVTDANGAREVAAKVWAQRARNKNSSPLPSSLPARETQKPAQAAPKDPARYFDRPEGVQDMKLSRVLRGKADRVEKGGDEKLAAAIKGGAKLPPVVVRQSRKVPGSFEVVSGGDVLEAARASGWEKIPVAIESEKPIDNDSGLKLALDLAKEWQKKLGDDVKVVMGGSLVSGTFVQAGNEPLDMDVRFLTKDPKSLIKRVEEATGLKLRKEIEVNDFPVGKSTAYMIEGIIEVNGVEIEVEGAVRTPSYVGWAGFYRQVFTDAELEKFRADKLRLKGDKKAYKALKSEMLAEAQTRAITRGLVKDQEYDTPSSWTQKPGSTTLTDERGYDRGVGLSSSERFAEQLFYDAIAANEAGLLDTYVEQNGNVVDADLMKTLSPIYREDPKFANAVHEPSSYLSKAGWREVLKRSADETAVFTAGGPGSGKSASGKLALQLAGLKEGLPTFDSSLTNFSAAVKRIEEAFSAGKKVHLVFTNTPAPLAFTWSLGRQRKMRASLVARMHINAAKTAAELIAKYGRTPGFSYAVINNQGGGRDGLSVGSVDGLPNYNYQELIKQFGDILNEARSTGKIDEDAWKFIASDVPGAVAPEAGRADEGKPEDGRRGADGGVRQAAQEVPEGAPAASPDAGAGILAPRQKRKEAEPVVVAQEAPAKAPKKRLRPGQRLHTNLPDPKIGERIAKQLGLTPQELAATSLPLATGKGKGDAFSLPAVGGLPSTVAELTRRRTESGLPELDTAKLEDREILAKLMAAETLAAINAEGSAVEWYDATIGRMLAMASVKYPELANDREARNSFVVAMAITSQGLNVENNLGFAMRQYEAYRESSTDPEKRRFPIASEGKNGKPMQNNFKIANAMIEELGLRDFRRMLRTEFTVGELKKAGYPLGGEKMGEKVLGSSIFGPKIGFGFYSNLSGNFEPVTMDMWFMRTIGRLSNTLRSFDAKKFKAQTDRFLAGLEERGDNALYADQLDQEMVEAAKAQVPQTDTETGEELLDADGNPVMGPDGDAIEALAREVNKRHQAEFKNRRAEFDAKTRVKSEIVKASETILKSLDKPRDSPASGGERQDLRDVVRRTVALVEKAYGKRVPPAALQALIWYPEQELYRNLGVSLNVTSQDYAGAIRKRLESEGYDGQQLSAAESGSSEAQRLAGKPDGRADQGDGQADGRDDALSEEERAAFLAARTPAPKVRPAKAPKQSRARYASDDVALEAGYAPGDYTALEGRTVERSITLDDGKVATLRMDAAQALRAHDARIDALQKLRACLKGAA